MVVVHFTVVGAVLSTVEVLTMVGPPRIDRPPAPGGPETIWRRALRFTEMSGLL